MNASRATSHDLSLPARRRAGRRVRRGRGARIRSGLGSVFRESRTSDTGDAAAGLFRRIITEFRSSGGAHDFDALQPCRAYRSGRRARPVGGFGGNTRPQYCTVASGIPRSGPSNNRGNNAMVIVIILFERCREMPSSSSDRFTNRRPSLSAND